MATKEANNEDKNRTRSASSWGVLLGPSDIAVQFQVLPLAMSTSVLASLPLIQIIAQTSNSRGVACFGM
jgi:hypothetical protein